MDDELEDSTHHMDSQRFKNLMSWMNQYGADASKMELSFYSENYRGVHASQPI